MALEAKQGPVLVYGQNPSGIGGPSIAPPDYNFDGPAPSLFDVGVGLIDRRYGYKSGGSGNNALLAIGAVGGGEYVAIDQVPSAINGVNVAAAQAATNGTAMTLVAATNATVTAILSAGLLIPQTGLTVPSGALVLEGTPAVITLSQQKSVGFPDATKAIARALSITAAATAPAGNFLVSSFDLYGNPQTETIAAAAGGATTPTTTNGKKGHKFIKSITPQFTSALTYSVGVADIFEFPIAVYKFAYASIDWANAFITANTGFVAADQTSPATATTGSVRGTYAVQSASDGIKALQVFISVFPPNTQNMNGTSSVFGVIPA